MEEGYVTCDLCNGTGFIYDKPFLTKSVCSKCFGLKKLTWLENILGKDKFDRIVLEPSCCTYTETSTIDEINPKDLSWAIKHIADKGTIELKAGEYELDPNIPSVIDKKITITGKDFTIKNGRIKNISPYELEFSNCSDATIKNLYITLDVTR